MSSRIDIPEMVNEIEDRFGSILEAPDDAFNLIRKKLELIELSVLVENFKSMRKNGYTKLQISKALRTTPPMLRRNLKKAEKLGLIKSDEAR